jgi:hypothetical protein
LSEGVKEKAERYRRFLEDETFVEIVELILEDQVDVFLTPNSAPDELEQARSIALALGRITEIVQSVIDEETFYDKKIQH